MKKSLLVIIILSFTHILSAQKIIGDWAYVQNDVAVNPFKIKYYKDGIVEMWTKHEYDEDYGYALTKCDLIDIKNEKIKPLEGVNYDKSGKVIKSYNYSNNMFNEWDRIIPGSVGELILDAARAVYCMDKMYETLRSKSKQRELFNSLDRKMIEVEGDSIKIRLYKHNKELKHSAIEYTESVSRDNFVHGMFDNFMMSIECVVAFRLMNGEEIVSDYITIDKYDSGIFGLLFDVWFEK
jgi:hypothetical protein